MGHAVVDFLGQQYWIHNNYYGELRNDTHLCTYGLASIYTALMGYAPQWLFKDVRQ